MEHTYTPHRQKQTRVDMTTPNDRELSSTGVSEEVLRKLASQLGPDWGKVASFLGLAWAEIRSIRSDNPLQTEEQAFQALIMWKHGQPRHADQIGTLCSALWQAGRIDLAERVQEGTRRQTLTYADRRYLQQGVVDGPKCHTNPDEVSGVYCETCSTLICYERTAVDHYQLKHHISDITTAAHRHSCLLREVLLPKLCQEIEELEESLKEISQTKQLFVEHFQAKKKFDALEVIAEEHRKMTQLRRQRDLQFNQLETRVSELLRRKQESLLTVRGILHNASARDFLSAYPKIRKKIEFLSSQRPPEVDPGLSYLRFPSNQRGCPSRYGKELQLCGRRDRPGDSSGAGKGITIYGARGIAILATREILVTDHYNNRVVVCNSRGQPQRVIRVLGKPLDVAAIPKSDRIVVVDSTKYVRVLSKEGTLQAKFPTVPPNEVEKTEVNLRSVAVKRDGTIVVGDVKRKVWTEHRPTDGALKRTMPVKTKPYFLAVDSTDRVVVSGIVSTVRVLDTNGITLFKIKPNVEGERVKQLSGVCCIGSDIYVTMNNGAEHTGHIHHYDSSGVFVGCLAQGEQLPLGMAFISNRQELAVANWSGGVNMYKLEERRPDIGWNSVPCTK
ncbi:uncharacterized protein LOC110984345 [Acanthaster planci]|uniref:Uncharacterized protein LOC110984345 n=1 Tax=Acanthaster planci TaxID=133434 RepID=A0A8B7Z5B4_ACAPL|nr:uncharacterized protein LOC110984345 [Acanthaster planci]XP_022100153.1 uncharacterized protein LOC110984345 [Acanthaster planci]XP_022100154.1 uncharacterized protein LOC110984345 [Acanthaster planci]XP_022100155.1 uncharacterized protein LOC110984345 [Acanthaster planci]